jgi:hypothetical protein
MFMGFRGRAREGVQVSPNLRRLGEDLRAQLMNREIEPWQPSYKHELATAIALGSAAEEKLKYTLPARFGSLGVIFEDADKARLLT